MENEAGEYRPQCCDARSVQNAGRYSSIAGLRTLYSGLTHQRATKLPAAGHVYDIISIPDSFMYTIPAC